MTVPLQNCAKRLFQPLNNTFYENHLFCSVCSSFPVKTAKMFIMNKF